MLLEVDKPTSLLFPGQALSASDIHQYYYYLKNVDPQITDGYINLAQSSVVKVNGDRAPFQIETELKKVASPNYQETQFVQPVIHALSLAALEIFINRIGQERWSRLPITAVAGHSLGEYSAFVAAKVLTWEDGMDIVAFRGMVMQKACDNPETKSGLAHLSKLVEDAVYKKCQQTDTSIALFNAPNLITVGGTLRNMDRLGKLAKSTGLHFQRLKTANGAFHTDCMRKPAVELGRFVADYPFSDPVYKIVSNFTGDVVESGRDLKENIVRSVTNPVQWIKTVATLVKLGTDSYIESGPGESLSGLNRRNGVDKTKSVNIREYFST